MCNSVSTGKKQTKALLKFLSFTLNSPLNHGGAEDEGQLLVMTLNGKHVADKDGA